MRDEIKTMPFEVLFGERDIVARNLQVNKEYMTPQMIENAEQYYKELCEEIQKRSV